MTGHEEVQIVVQLHQRLFLCKWRVAVPEVVDVVDVMLSGLGIGVIGAFGVQLVADLLLDALDDALDDFLA